MLDYYQILELNKAATTAQIRAAYKRLAMAYHPDLNGGNKDAEERFKQINEAYHVLSDPLKKSRYDNTSSASYESVLTDAYYEEIRKKKFTRWHKAQQEIHYRIDKNYYKIQGLAFVAFIVIAGFSFSVFHVIEFFIEKEREKQWQANTMLLNEVNHMFSQGLFDNAFHRMDELHQLDPTEYRFHFTKDSLVSALRTMAEGYYQSREYTQAVIHYEALNRHDEFNNLKYTERIASCEYYLGHYEKSIRSMKQLLNQLPEDFGLVYQIARISLEDLHDLKEAEIYFTLGKKLFKKNLTEIYGEAFELVMNPKDAPDIYFQLFIGRAKTNMALGNYKEAITDCNWAVLLRRDSPEGYSLRASIKIKMNNREGLCHDLIQASERKDQQAVDLLQKYCR